MQNHVQLKLQELQDALDRFETSVEMPFVPGEMERWTAAVETAWVELIPRLNWLLTERHPQQYQEIGAEDPELLGRIDQLRDEDDSIQLAAVEFGRRIPKTRSAIEAVEPDEAKLKPAVETIVRDASQFVFRIRKQQRAVQTWLLEAYTRDRGDVD